MKKCIEEMRFTYEQLITEIKYNSELKIREILQESVKERRKLKLNNERRITETKQKQWCANCGKESIYYCCWNTSYCDEECQRIHWTKHLKTCTRIGENAGPHNPQSNTSINEEPHQGIIEELPQNSDNNNSYTNNNPTNKAHSHATGRSGMDFDFNQHYQHQQQQQRILKQKRKISPHSGHGYYQSQSLILPPPPQQRQHTPSYANNISLSGPSSFVPTDQIYETQQAKQIRPGQTYTGYQARATSSGQSNGNGNQNSFMIHNNNNKVL